MFAFPSETDQAPDAVLETVAAGLPVVAGPTGAVGEMVVDGVTMGAGGWARFDRHYQASRAVYALLDVVPQARRRHGRDRVR